MSALTKPKPQVPSEHEEQVALMHWARMAAGKHPELGMLYAIPNGGKRHPVVANKLRAEGVKSGVPDLCLPVARGGWHGLYVEMKRRKGGSVSPDQRTWIDHLTAQRYKAVVCHGWEEAKTAIQAYLATGNADLIKGAA